MGVVRAVGRYVGSWLPRLGRHPQKRRLVAVGQQRERVLEHTGSGVVRYVGKDGDLRVGWPCQREDGVYVVAVGISGPPSVTLGRAVGSSAVEAAAAGERLRLDLLAGGECWGEGS